MYDVWGAHVRAMFAQPPMGAERGAGVRRRSSSAQDADPWEVSEVCFLAKCASRAGGAALGKWPAGTRPFDGCWPCEQRARAAPLTCSDKLAIWNALGLQGRRLLDVLPPIYAETCTIGRKFSAPHAARALCCRLQDFVSGKVPRCGAGWPGAGR